MSAKSIRLVVLVIVLAVGTYLLYLKYTRSNAADEPSPEQEKALAQGRDVSSLTPEAVPVHVKALADKDAAQRQKAARALWQIGPRAKAATPALLGAVKDPDAEVRALAAKALGPVSEGTADAVPSLVEALKDPQADVRREAAASLAEIWRADQRPAQGSSREKRDLAEEGKEIKERTGRGPALPATKKDDPDEREREQEREREREAGGRTEAVSRLKPSSEPAARAAIPVLTEALRDEDAHVRAAAAEALSETGPLAKPAVPELIRILEKDADKDARLQACLALGNTGPDAKAGVPVLIRALLREKVTGLPSGRAKGGRPSDEYHELLGIRANAAAALGQIRSDPEKAVPALVEACLTDPESEVRGWSIWSLSQFPSTAPKLAEKTLETLAKDPRNQQLPEFQERVKQFRKTLATASGAAGRHAPPATDKAKEKTTPAPKDSSSTSK
jgi:HEAT repeat protein